MTWKTVQGERVLSPNEAKLFASALATMIDMANDSGEGLNFGMPLVAGPFERLSMAQKYTVLEEVTRALLHPTPTCPPLRAVNESAIYYVFAWLRQEFETPEDAEEVWGQLVLNALRDEPDPELDGDGEDDEGFRPRMGCHDFDKWETAVEELADRILWDRDFEMEAELGGGAAQGLMDRMNIDPDYFAPHTAAAARGAKQRLYDMVRAVSG